MNIIDTDGGRQHTRYKAGVTNTGFAKAAAFRGIVGMPALCVLTPPIEHNASVLASQGVCRALCSCSSGRREMHAPSSGMGGPTLASIDASALQLAPTPLFTFTNSRVTTLGQPLEVVKVSITTIDTQNQRSKHTPSDSCRGNLLLHHDNNTPAFECVIAHPRRWALQEACKLSAEIGRPGVQLMHTKPNNGR